jgi:hypothetical protein
MVPESILKKRKRLQVLRKDRALSTAKVAKVYEKP